MNLAEAIKKCAEEMMDAKVQCDVIIGKVANETPCVIRAGNAELTGEILYIADTVREKKCTIRIGGYEKEIVVNEGLKKGDTVVVLRQSGGSCYAVLARV